MLCFSMNITKPGLSLVLSALGLAYSAPSFSLHSGDVFPDVVNGQIVFNNGELITNAAASNHSVLSTLAGVKFFSGDFGDIPGGPRKTSNPGFDHEDGRLPALSLIGIQAVGQLLRWDGSAWSVAAATLSLDEALGNILTWTGSGPGLTNYGYLDQASASGNLHQHVDYSINSGAATGAYLFTLSLFAQQTPADIFNPPAPSSSNRVAGVADSAPIALVLNHGLSATAFEAGIASLTATPPTPTAVPLPGMGLLWGACMFGLLGTRDQSPA